MPSSSRPKSRAGAKRPGWRLAYRHGKYAEWDHYGGGKVLHCGHPTALRPYYAVLDGERVVERNDTGGGHAVWSYLADAQRAVDLATAERDGPRRITMDLEWARQVEEDGMGKDIVAACRRRADELRDQVVAAGFDPDPPPLTGDDADAQRRPHGWVASSVRRAIRRCKGMTWTTEEDDHEEAFDASAFVEVNADELPSTLVGWLDEMASLDVGEGVVLVWVEVRRER